MAWLWGSQTEVVGDMIQFDRNTTLKPRWSVRGIGGNLGTKNIILL